MNAPMGGYFELELARHEETGLHTGRPAYQSARAALHALLISSRPRPARLWMPRYICDAMISPVLQAGVEVSHYGIDRDFNIRDDIDLQAHDWLLYVNYFGICGDQVRHVLSRFSPAQVILDCSQAWFARPSKGLATIYSPRKFFGVPDGGILYTDIAMDTDGPMDQGSFDRASHLLKRLAEGPESGYADYQAAEASLDDLEPRHMSLLTRRLLNSVDQHRAREARNRNFAEIHKVLHSSNRLDIPQEIDGPLCYPFLSDDDTLRQRLLARRVFTPTYWQDALKRLSPDAPEAAMVHRIIPLPIDQRYGIEDMHRMLEMIHA